MIERHIQRKDDVKTDSCIAVVVLFYSSGIEVDSNSKI